MVANRTKFKRNRLAKPAFTGHLSQRSSEHAQEAVGAEGGTITMEDMARYRTEWVEPVRTSHNGFQVFAPGWPVAGGVATIEGLNLFAVAGLHERPIYTERGRTRSGVSRYSNGAAVVQ